MKECKMLKFMMTDIIRVEMNIRSKRSPYRFMSGPIELECTPASRYNGGLKQNDRCFLLGPLNSPLYYCRLSSVSEVWEGGMEPSSLCSFFLSGDSPSITCVTLSLSSLSNLLWSTLRSILPEP